MRHDLTLVITAGVLYVSCGVMALFLWIRDRRPPQVPWPEVDDDETNDSTLFTDEDNHPTKRLPRIPGHDPWDTVPIPSDIRPYLSYRRARGTSREKHR